jgi:outer membrane protein OmpA-like peptidoglycan-associated protein
MKIIFTIISIHLLFLSSLIAQDQKNLVKNPSFEIIDGKLKKPGQIDIAEDWFSPTALKADLFSKTKQGPIGVPDNNYGKEFAKDGANYAGVVAYSYNNNKPRTYLQAQLSKSLTSGVDYCVKFNLSLSDLSKYAIDKIGIHISPDAVSLDRKGDIIFTDRSGEFSSVITGLGSKVYSKRYNWETVCGIYHAEGKEKFITIGNFYNGKDTKAEKLKKLPEFSVVQFPEAYYYIDNVEVLMISDETECDCVNSTKKKKESIVYQSSFVDNGASLTVEQKLKRYTIYFDVESSNIEDSFEETLDKIVTLLKDNSSLSIQINGHTDKAEKEAIKDDPENDNLIKLGMYRADNIKKFLTNNGIDSKRLSPFDAGAEAPASPGLSRLSLAKSRRVEFIITK